MEKKKKSVCLQDNGIILKQTDSTVNVFLPFCPKQLPYMHSKKEADIATGIFYCQRTDFSLLSTLSLMIICISP